MIIKLGTSMYTNIAANKIWKTTMTSSLPSGALIDVTESTVLSKYIINDLQIFSKGCLISLISSTYSTNISLMCSPLCSSTVIRCTYDIPSGIYNMYVYDIEEEDTLSDE